MPTSDAYPASHGSRGVAVLTEYKQGQKQEADKLPMRIAVLGQGSASPAYTAAKRRVYSAKEVGELYGYTSPLYLIARVLFPENGEGVGDIPVTIYPLSVATGTESTGSITPSGSGTKTEKHWIEVNNIKSNVFSAVNGDTVATLIDKAVAAVNAVLGMPVTASDGTTTLDFEAGWEGDTGDNIVVKWVVPDDSDWSFTGNEANLTSGAGTVAVDAASEGLNLVGTAWDTLFISAFDYTDSDNLDAFSTFGEGRHLPAVGKPMLAFTGCNEATIGTVTAVTDARKTDRTNCIVPNPGSHDLPFLIAADAVRRIAVLANNNPSHDYGLQKLTNLTPALDSVQWGDTNEAAFDAGCSTIIVQDSVVKISDVLTCYHPTGEDPAPYAYAVDNVKLWNVRHNFNGVFDTEEWKSGPALVPDDQTVDPSTRAKKPKDAVAAMAGIFTRLAKGAIISDPDYAMENSTATINGTNPKRLDIIAKFKISGNVNVLPITLQWSFYFGGAS